MGSTPQRLAGRCESMASSHPSTTADTADARSPMMEPNGPNKKSRQAGAGHGDAQSHFRLSNEAVMRTSIIVRMNIHMGDRLGCTCAGVFKHSSAPGRRNLPKSSTEWPGLQMLSPFEWFSCAFYSPLCLLFMATKPHVASSAHLAFGLVSSRYVFEV